VRRGEEGLAQVNRPEDIRAWIEGQLYKAQYRALSSAGRSGIYRTVEVLLRSFLAVTHL
jgi:hypothetical protein